MSHPPDHRLRLARAERALRGLVVGDAFGDQFFVAAERAQEIVRERRLPDAPWRYTDDTVMSLAVVDILREQGAIHQDALAAALARRYADDPARGYGGTAHGILRRIGAGEPWSRVAASVFSGMGSRGNGGAMRAAPIGAYFADDLERAAAEAAAAAAVTHAHEDGIAGAEAIAVAAAWAARARPRPRVDELFDVVLARTRDSNTRGVLGKASRLPRGYDLRTAVSALGNGARLLSEDTVPLALWVVARHWGQLEDALWTLVSARGDSDTLCAIAGGVLASAPSCVVPRAWRARCEPWGAPEPARADLEDAGTRASEGSTGDG